MKNLINLFFLVMFIAFVPLLTGCKKNEVITPEPEEEVKKVKITIKAVANDCYYAYLKIDALDMGGVMTEHSEDYSWYSIEVPFQKEHWGQSYDINVRVSIYPNGYGTEPRIKKEETKNILVDQDKEVIFDFN